MSHPIVLCHGLMGFIHLVIGGFNVLTYFRGVAEHLRASGYKVYVTEVAKTKGIAYRASQLREQLLRFGEDKYHLIGHSMGGLDARYLITHLKFADRIASLTSVASPHRGTSICDWGIRHFGKRAFGFPLLEKIGMDTEAIHNLTIEAMTKFNEETPDHPEVRYYSYSGSRGRMRTSLPLQFSYHLISKNEGANDGLVSVESAKWGSYLGDIEADHLHQIGWSTLPGIIDRFDHLSFYLSHAREITKNDFADAEQEEAVQSAIVSA
ncbi:MAG: hypothetical protein NUW37_03010 [Planctomycetes bacterium]|nr:hypothetical protein [Planctomycetota bacterium]